MEKKMKIIEIFVTDMQPECLGMTLSVECHKSVAPEFAVMILKNIIDDIKQKIKNGELK